MTDTRSEKERLRGDGFGKLFSKKWWDNFWFYYKKIVIIGICAVFVIGFTIYEAVTKVDPDSQINYIGYHNFSDEQMLNLKEQLTNLSGDINGDKKAEVSLKRYQFDPDKAEEDQGTANQLESINLNLAVGDQVVYLMDRKSFDLFGGQTNDYFIDVTKLAEKYHISPDKVVTSKGHTVGINLSGSQFLKDCKINIDSIKNGQDNGIYLVIRKQRNSEKDDEEKKANYENSLQIAEKILKTIPQ